MFGLLPSAVRPARADKVTPVAPKEAIAGVCGFERHIVEVALHRGITRCFHSVGAMGSGPGGSLGGMAARANVIRDIAGRMG